MTSFYFAGFFVLTVIIIVTLHGYLNKRSNELIDSVVYPVITEDYSQLENEILKEINKVRKIEKLHPLKFNDVVTLICQKHINNSLRYEKVSHDDVGFRFSEIREMIPASRLGEVVAYGYRNAESVVQAFLLSPEHKKIILGDYNEMGISAQLDHKQKMYVGIITIKRK